MVIINQIILAYYCARIIIQNLNNIECHCENEKKNSIYKYLLIKTLMLINNVLIQLNYLQ